MGAAISAGQRIQGCAILVPQAPPNRRKAQHMDTTPSANRKSELDVWRAKIIIALHDLADLLADTSPDDFPTPNIYADIYCVDAPTDDEPYKTFPLVHGHVRLAMRVSPGGWSKHASANYISYTKVIGKALRVRFEVNRATTCRRIQTGVKTVDAVEAHTEPVYEWVCDEPEIEI